MSESNISPLAKRLAEENNVDWRRLLGSGPDGRVVERDVLEYLARVMSGEEALDPTPEPLPQGLSAWPEDDVRGFESSRQPSRLAEPQEEEMDLEGFQQGVAQTRSMETESDDDLLLSMGSGSQAQDVRRAPAQFPTREAMAGRQEDDDLLEIDDDFEFDARPQRSPAPAAVSEAPEPEPTISEDLFLFDDEEQAEEVEPEHEESAVFGKASNAFAVAVPADEAEDEPLFDLGGGEADAGADEPEDLWSVAPAAAVAAETDDLDDADLLMDDGDLDNDDGNALAGSEFAAAESDDTSDSPDGADFDLAEFEQGLPSAGLRSDEADDETFMPVDLDFGAPAEPSEPSFHADSAGEDGDFAGGAFAEPEESPDDLVMGLDEESDEPVESADFAPVAAAAVAQPGDDDEVLVEAEMNVADRRQAGGVELVSYGMLLRRHLDLTALSLAQHAVGREFAAGKPVSPAAFLLRAAAKALREAPLGSQGPVGLAVISDRGLGVSAFADAATQAFGSLLEDVEATQAAKPVEQDDSALVIADMSEYEVDEAVLNAGAPVLTLGRILYDSSEGRYRSTLSLSGEVSAEQGSRFLGRVAELLDAPVLLVI